MGKRAKARKEDVSGRGEAPQARLPHSTPRHLRSIDHAVAIAMALPGHLVRRPSAPVEALLRDARTVSAAAREHLAALVARGMGEGAADELVARADALSQAQAMWLTDRSRGLCKDASSLLLREAEGLLADAVAVLTLALRKSREGQERLASLSGGEGILELVDDLKRTAALVRAADDALFAINEDAASLAKELDRARKRVESAVIDDEAASIVSPSKDSRDRLAVLVEDAIDEVRAFAFVAFRADPTTARRGAFATVSRSTSGAGRRDGP